MKGLAVGTGRYSFFAVLFLLALATASFNQLAKCAKEYFLIGDAHNYFKLNEVMM